MVNNHCGGYHFRVFTCGIFRAAGASEANHLIMVSLVALAVISMIIIMILQQDLKRSART
jgi:hypothetical protein